MSKVCILLTYTKDNAGHRKTTINNAVSIVYIGGAGKKFEDFLNNFYN